MNLNVVGKKIIYSDVLYNRPHSNLSPKKERDLLTVKRYMLMFCQDISNKVLP